MKRFVTRAVSLVSGLALVAGSLALGVISPAEAASTRNACLNANAGSNVKCIFPVEQTLSATEGVAITDTATFTASNPMTAPFTYAVSPALPAGLTLDTATGVISGTPTAATASAEYTITMTDASTETANAYITIVVAAGSGGGGGGGQVNDRKVTICHRTHSTTNPYVRITVDYNSINKAKGHSGHDEIFQDQHVYNSAINYRAKDKLWGDIIPADPTGQDRWQPLNWTELGEKIYNGTVAGCAALSSAEFYNKMRESGVPAKDIKDELTELEAEQLEADPSFTSTDPTTITYTGTDTEVASKDNDKVTICHRTNSTTNPYRKITVSANSILKTKGHASHNESYDGHPVFDSSVTYPSNKKDWGDIIPADPTGQNRWQPLNWTALGQDIYNGVVPGCAETSIQDFYNALREDGLTKKQIKADLEDQGSVDDDPVEVDDIKYTGTDPEVTSKEPAVPSVPADKVVPDQSLSGIIWLDLNKDGLKDPDEPLMPGVTLTLNQGVPVNTSYKRTFATSGFHKASSITVVTDANGFYLFPSIGAGDWTVTTTVPSALFVTYDSFASSDGQIVTNVPVGSSAFTWVGLVGTAQTDSDKVLQDILTDNPSALPLTELPEWLQTIVQDIITKNNNGGSNNGGSNNGGSNNGGSNNGTGTEALAETGGNQVWMLLLGLALVGAGLFGFGGSRSTTRR